MRYRTYLLRSCVALFVSLVALQPYSAMPAGAATVTASVDVPVEVDENTTFSAPVVITTVTDLNAAQFDVSFAPDVLELTAVHNGEINGREISCQSNELEAGRWRVVASLGLGTVSGLGTVAVLEFSVIGSPGDESAIEFSGGILSGLYEAIDATWTGGSTSVVAPPTPPTVIANYPIADAVDVPINCGLSATFSEDMDESTITDTSFTLENGSVVGTVSYDVGSRTAYFLPAADLEHGTVYTARLDATVASSIGASIGAAYVWTFTTQAGCFIATAAYGTSLDTRLDTLRAFRDKRLLTHALGQAFVAFYYRTSPPAASAIQERPVARFVVRLLLWPCVVVAGAALKSPWMLLAIGLAAAGLALAVVCSRRARHDA